MSVKKRLFVMQKRITFTRVVVDASFAFWQRQRRRAGAPRRHCSMFGKFDFGRFDW
jgi:hypothetical protein